MGFGDSMKLGDAFEMKLECGHPNQKAGSKCELCGKEVPGQPELKDEVAGEEKIPDTHTKELSDGTGPLQKE